MPRIEALMADGLARSALEVSQAIDAEKKYVRSVFADLVREGSAYIESYRGANHTMFYKMGEGENAERPVNKTPEHKLAKSRVKNRMIRSNTPRKRLADRDLDELRRTSAYWWPRADPVVVSAMSAMVRAGRSA